MDHPFNVIDQKSTVRIKIGTCLQAGFCGCPELPDACVHKVLVVGGAQRRDKLGLGPHKSLELFIERPVGCDVLVARRLIRSVP
jgi:hypothetical protein